MTDRFTAPHVVDTISTALNFLRLATNTLDQIDGKSPDYDDISAVGEAIYEVRDILRNLRTLAEAECEMLQQQARAA